MQYFVSRVSFKSKKNKAFFFLNIHSFIGIIYFGLSAVQLP